MKWKLITIFLVLYSLSMSTVFEGERKGLILGGGIGYQKSNIENTGKEEDKFSFATNMKIGYGFNERNEIFYFSKVAWFDEEYEELEENLDSTFGIVGIGYTRYLNKNWFLSSGLGVAQYTFDWQETGERSTSFGGYVGGGIAIDKHYIFELDYLFGNPEDNYNKHKANIFMMTINAELF